MATRTRAVRTIHARPMRWLLASLVLIGVMMSTQAALADRLVMRDGSEIETRGPWKVKGRQVVFTLQSGTLSSLRLDDVDLEASEAATRADAEPEPAVESETENTAPSHAEDERPEPVLVITDRDIPRAKPAGNASSADDSADADGGGSEDDSPADEQAPGSEVLFAAEGLEITSWQPRDSPRGGIEITGVLANRGDQLVAEASIQVTTTANDGVDRTYSAHIGNATLAAGHQSPFRILLPDVVSVDDSLTFDVEGRAVRPRILPSAPPSTDADGEGGEDDGSGFVEGDSSR